jgi:NADPH:quinone reductase-like Zn-dependent oxidoreductase
LTRYGSPDNLQLKEVAKPIPKDNEVLVKVHASTVTKADTMMRRADPFVSRFFLGFFKPKNPVTGTGFAGKIEAVGKAVTQFNIGDEVFGETGVNFGANAEYITLPADGVLALKPANLRFEEAATITDGPLTSLNFLKNLAQLKKGQKLLVNGASGSLGTAAVQIAKYYGAEVTGVASTQNLELVKSLGADHLVDYTKADFTKSGQVYDIIFDTIGKSPFSKSKKALAPKGIYLSPKISFGLLFQMLWTAKFGLKKALFSATGLLPHPALRSLLAELLEMMAQGKLKSVIDRQYPLEQAALAHRYVDTGHKRGNVVLVKN